MGFPPRRLRSSSSTIIGLFVAAAVISVACTPIDQVDFANFRYASDACGSIFETPPADGYEVVDGGVRHGDPSQADFYSVSVRREVAIGDLTGDGLDEAGLIIDCSTGNRPVPVGRIMTTDGTETVALAPVPTPPLPPDARRIALAELDIDHGTLMATWVVLRSEDPSCCPTGRLTTAHHWQGNRFDTRST